MRKVLRMLVDVSETPQYIREVLLSKYNTIPIYILFNMQFLYKLTYI